MTRCGGLLVAGGVEPHTWRSHNTQRHVLRHLMDLLTCVADRDGLVMLVCISCNMRTLSD